MSYFSNISKFSPYNLYDIIPFNALPFPSQKAPPTKKVCQETRLDDRTSTKTKLTSLVRPRSKIDKERENKREKESESEREKERESEGGKANEKGRESEKESERDKERESESANKRGGLGALCAYGSSEEEEEGEAGRK